MKSVTLYNAQEGQKAFAALWPLCKATLIAGQKLVVSVKEATRSTIQNSRMWAMLGDVSRQVEWYGKRLTPEDWKHVFTASLRKLDVVPNLDGTGFVALGLHTSRMSKREMSELIDLIDAFGSQRGVKWSDPALAAYEQEMSK